jgi:uncharacterized protein YneF (UPF0154 family)
MVILTVPGEREPEVYLVCSGVFAILGKMLATNQLSSSFGHGPRFEYEEVRFLLKLMGAPCSIAMQGKFRPGDLWISGD